MERIFSPGNLIIKNTHIFGRNRKQKFDILILKNIIEKITPAGKLPDYPDIKKVNFKSETIYPGFNDAHTHFLWMGLNKLKIDLTKTQSAKDVYEKVREKVKVEDKHKPLIGEGYDESKWVDTLPVDKAGLDKAAPDNPVVLRRVCGHRGVANTKALRKIPVDWKIVNRENGELLEDAVLYIHKIFPPEEHELYQGLKFAVKMAERNGVTSVSDIVNDKYLKIYQKYFRENKPGLRVTLYPVAEFIDEITGAGLESGWGDEYLKMGGIKIFIDGSIGAYTAALKKKYKDKKTKGVLIYKTGELKKNIKQADSNNLQLMIHAIGDRAIEQVLGIFEKIDFNKKLRHRLEHVELITDEQIKRAAELGLVLSMQPNFVGEWSAPGGMYEKRLPDLYFKNNNPFKKVIKKKCPIAFGSDTMPFGPWYGIQSAVNHPIKQSAITFHQAINAYTAGSAYAEHSEKIKGRIKPGFLADLIYNLPTT